MARFCSSCGSEIGDNAAFCAKCGKATAAQATDTSPAVSAAPATSAGLQDNVAGLLAYLVIPAIIFLVLEPYNRNKFIRFHSFQAIALWIVCMIVSFVMGLVPIVNLFLLPLLGLAEVIVAVVCMIKAFQNQLFKLPVIGDFAEKQANA